MIIKNLFTLVLLVHGLIHVGGAWANSKNELYKKYFIKEGKKFTITFYSWIITGMLFGFSAGLYFVDWDFYWIILICAFALSQLLIFRFWTISKYGTFINAIVLIASIVAAGSYNLDQQIKKEIITLKSKADYSTETITTQRIESLPMPVKRWLVNSGVVGRVIPSVIFLKQSGQLRSKKDGPWSYFQAQQFFSTNPPAFVWDADIEMNEFIHIKGRDKFEDGKGNMLIKADSYFSIANSIGKEIDQGTLLRYMAEISWFPQAALKNYLHWDKIDSTHARVSMTYGTVNASGIFTFGNNGLPFLFEAKRYGDFNGKYLLETWSVKTTAYKTFEGITIGNSNEVTWKLSSGDFTWLKLEVTDIKYD